MTAIVARMPSAAAWPLKVPLPKSAWVLPGASGSSAANAVPTPSVPATGVSTVTAAVAATRRRLASNFDRLCLALMSVPSGLAEP